MPKTVPRLAKCPRCGVSYGHPGPCPRCVPLNGVRLNAAMRLAAEFHDMQFRRGDARDRCDGVNFIVHPAEVVKLLWAWGFRVESHFAVFEAAWLHDGPEDSPRDVDPEDRFKRIAAEISTETASIVRELTREGNRRAAYKKSFGPGSKPRKSVESLIVKVADQVVNTEDFLLVDPRYATTYANGAHPVFEALDSRREEVRAYAARGTLRPGYGESVWSAMTHHIHELRRSLVAGLWSVAWAARRN